MGRLLLTLSVLLVTIIFMGTSFAVATDHTDQFVASGDNADSVPYAQGNSIINDSHVYTTASASGNPFIGNLPTHKDASVTDKVIQNITVGGYPIAVAFDSLNGYLYVANVISDNVSVINGSTNKIIQSITAGKSPNGVTFNSSNGYVYVSNYCSDNVSVIDGSTNKVIQSINVGKGPVGVAFDSSNGNIYVTNAFSNNVSVLGYVKYAVAFTETGLPSGSTWYVNTTGHNSSALTGPTYSVNLTNGTFAYSVQTSNKLYGPSASSGSLMVNGSAIQETITFSPVTYKVTFTETGLPSGTIWYANVTNSTGYIYHGSSITNTITFNLINGTYSFLNSTSDKIYEPSSYAGTFTVSGTAVNLHNVVFSQITYKVTFTESGLPAGSWYVNLSNGQTFPSTETSISFSEPNGTYSYSIANANKSLYSSGGNFTVNGKALTKSITFSPVTYAVTFTETGLPIGSDW